MSALKVYFAQVGQAFVIAIVVGVAAVIAAFAAAHQVEDHIDATIANTVNSQIAKSRSQSEQTQKLFKEVDTICQSLAATNSEVHC